MKHETKAQARYVRMSPRKIRLLVDLIRGMQVGRALEQLQLTSKGASDVVVKLLRSAIANAIHNHQMAEASLIVKSVFVDGGPIQYRWMPRAHGRASPIRKRTSHLTIVLEGDVVEGKKKKTVEEPIDAEVVETKEKAPAKGKEKKPVAKKKPVTKKKEPKT